MVELIPRSNMSGWGARSAFREALHGVRWQHRLRRIRRRNPVLVYQMGKVGSRTVVDSIRSLGLEEPVVHVHTLDPMELERAISQRRASSRPWLPGHLHSSRILIRAFDAGLFPCRVVTLARDPVARAISFAFEDIEAKAPGESRDRPDREEMERAVTRMLRSHPEHADPSRWFDRELKGVLGVDVFRQPYDVDAGYTLLEGPVPVLVIRTEDLDRALPEALGRFLDRDPSGITVTRSNVGAQRAHAESLRSVKASYRLTADLAKEVLQSPYVRHFYAQDMAALRARWMARESS